MQLYRVEVLNREEVIAVQPDVPLRDASGWSGRRVGLAPTGKRRLVKAHTHGRRSFSEALRLNVSKLNG